MRQGNYTQAIQYYDKALAIDPKYVSALTGIGNVSILVTCFILSRKLYWRFKVH